MGTSVTPAHAQRHLRIASSINIHTGVCVKKHFGLFSKQMERHALTLMSVNLEWIRAVLMLHVLSVTIQLAAMHVAAHVDFLIV